MKISYNVETHVKHHSHETFGSQVFSTLSEPCKVGNSFPVSLELLPSSALIDVEVIINIGASYYLVHLQFHQMYLYRDMEQKSQYVQSYRPHE